MNIIWDEKRIRRELERLDGITGLHGAELPMTFGNARFTLGQFSGCPMEFRFSNYWFQDPNWPVECALDVIRHEYAHYMDYEIYGNSSHGSTWKTCCCAVGAAPRRLYSEEQEEYYRRRHQKEDEMNRKYDTYQVGDLLLHPRYEFGKICSIEGEGVNRYVLVDFDTVGMKKLAVRWVAENCEVETSE